MNKKIIILIKNIVSTIGIFLGFIVVFYLLPIYIFTPNQNFVTNKNIFIVDTLINNDSNAVLKMNDIEIVVPNYDHWKINDTLVIYKK